jgi:ACS family hexuronate transporter-like MFS transporter
MASLPSASPAPLTRFRWVICGLLFSAITVNYVDRALFGQLAPELRKTFGWSSGEVADILLWFEVAYAIGLALAGRILDRVGTKLGLAVSFAAW